MIEIKTQSELLTALPYSSIGDIQSQALVAEPYVHAVAGPYISMGGSVTRSSSAPYIKRASQRKAALFYIVGQAWQAYEIRPLLQAYYEGLGKHTIEE